MRARKKVGGETDKRKIKMLASVCVRDRSRVDQKAGLCVWV